MCKLEKRFGFVCTLFAATLFQAIFESLQMLREQLELVRSTGRNDPNRRTKIYLITVTPYRIFWDDVSFFFRTKVLKKSANRVSMCVQTTVMPSHVCRPGYKNLAYPKWHQPSQTEMTNFDSQRARDRKRIVATYYHSPPVVVNWQHL